MTSSTASAKRPGVLVASGQGERLLTVEEVAEWLGVPVGTIYAWRYRSTGPASYKVERHVRFRRADVERWLEDQRTEPIQPSTLRRLLGVATVRNPARTPNLQRTGVRPTIHSRIGPSRRAGAAPGAHSANPRPHPRILRGRGRALGAADEQRLQVAGFRPSGRVAIGSCFVFVVPSPAECDRTPAGAPARAPRATVDDDFIEVPMFTLPKR